MQAVTSQAERRASIRFPSRLKAPCRLLSAIEEGPWWAPVRNISPEGVGLTVDRKFEPGTILTMQLPTRARNSFGEPKLLRVRHTQLRLGHEWWELGGAFHRALAKEELEVLKKSSPSVIPQREQRTRVRHATRLNTHCRVLRATQIGPWSATIRNVSATGMSLISDRPFKPGQVLTIALPVRNFEKPRVFHIKHVQPKGQWSILGGSFDKPLQKSELEALL